MLTTVHNKIINTTCIYYRIPGRTKPIKIELHMERKMKHSTLMCGCLQSPLTVMSLPGQPGEASSPPLWRSKALDSGICCLCQGSLSLSPLLAPKIFIQPQLQRHKKINIQIIFSNSKS